MRTKQLYAHFAEKLGLPEKLVREFFRELPRLATQELRRNGEFVLPGLVKVVIQSRKARMGRNPATGAPVKVPPKKVVKARIFKALKDAVLSPTRLAKPTLRISKTKKAKARVAMPPSEPNAEVIRVFYGTDRKHSPSQTGHFTTERADSLSVGWCDVSIPPDHRLAVIERPRITRLEFREDQKKHFVIIARAVQSPEEFWDNIKGLGKKSTLLFIHGFSVVFDDAIYRAAQLAYDLEFKGVPMLYSWASSGTKARYTADIGNNDFTVETLKEFLIDAMRKSGVQEIHVVAHSMGNRALVNALFQLAAKWRSDGLPRIQNLFLTAPDIDRGVFLKLAATMATTAKKTTLYASSKDKALKLSKTLQIYPRAGDAKEIVVVDGIDSIDATHLKTDFLSHSYYGDHRSVISDFHELMEYGSEPGKRFGLRGIPKKSPRYWEFRPSR